MNEKRLWTDQEDRILKKLVEDTKFTKWTHIARTICDEYGIKGRNGKQCKERYTKHINPQHPQEEWSYQEHLRMMELHNQLGNKWAIIGQRLGGRSDNSVKNSFYSLLRKALKKINTVIQQQYKSQLKEIKLTILYNVIEVADEKIRGTEINRELQFAHFSNELKNELLYLSLEDDEENSQEESEKDRNKTKQTINRLVEFGVRYKKRGKKSKNTSKGLNLLTPNRYVIRKTNSENEQSQSSNIGSSSVSNLEQISEDDIFQSSINRSLRRNSCNSLNIQQTDKSLEEMPSTRSRTRSQGNIFRRFSQKQGFQMKDQNQAEASQIQNIKHNNQQVQNTLKGLWQQQNQLPLLMIKKSSSRLSQEALIQAPEFHFFQDSEIEMRILPQLNLNMKQSQVDQNLFHQ